MPHPFRKWIGFHLDCNFILFFFNKWNYQYNTHDFLDFVKYSPQTSGKKSLEIFSGIFSNFGSSRAVESVLSENLITTFSCCNDFFFFFLTKKTFSFGLKTLNLHLSHHGLGWVLNKTCNSKLIFDCFHLCSWSFPISGFCGRSFLAPERCKYPLLLGDISVPLVTGFALKSLQWVTVHLPSPMLPSAHTDLFEVLLLPHNTSFSLN